MDTSMIMLFISALHMAPAPDTFTQTPTTYIPSKAPPPKAHSFFEGPSHRSPISSPQSERTIDKVMKKATGLNYHGLGVKKETGSGSTSGSSSKLSSTASLRTDLTTSYGYGFYWTCCNQISAKAKVMGKLGGVMEVAVKGPCKRKNSLAEEKCGKCGHEVCGDCEKVAECAK